MSRQTYLVALGSNVAGRGGSPRALLKRVTLPGIELARSPIHASRPDGPSLRTFANAVAVVESELAPPAMLVALKRIERELGRRAGRRWGPRVLDLDIIGWSGGIWTSAGLAIPHAGFRARRFVLVPLVAVTPEWRDPVTRLTPRHLLARLTRKKVRS